MVVAPDFQEIYDVMSQFPSLSLPAFKQTLLKIDFKSEDDCQTVYCGPKPILPFANSEVFHANILDWRRLTAEYGDCKAVYEVTFCVAGSNFCFKAGDTIGVIPHNDESDVNFLLSHLDLRSQADLSYTLSVDNKLKGKIPAYVPQISTLRHVLSHCIDLRSVIKKLFLLALSRFTKEDNERKVLEYLCSKEGSAAYSTHILNRNLCILDLFSIFSSCKPPVEVLLANLPRLLPRPYSIVNSGLKDGNKLKICFSILNMTNNRKGLTTGWLEDIILKKEFNLENGMRNLTIGPDIVHNKVPIYIRKNLTSFYLPQNKSPIILIGPGTGVSPFIGFLEEKEQQYDNNKEIGDIYLYFGCRSPILDFIYEKELKDFLTRGILKNLSVAFSRVEHHGIKYIQDALLQDGEEVVKLIKDGAFIFVCGDLKTMAAQVKETIVKCLINHDAKSQEEAEKILACMHNEKKFIVDNWS